MVELLAGKNSLVTGGGRSLGQAIALRLSEAGVNVVLVARSKDQLEATAALIQHTGGRAHVVPADLNDPASPKEIAARAEDAFGPIDVLINNAAVLGPLGASEEADTAAWDTTLRVNVSAIAALSFAILPGMRSRGWGRIVNVSSGLAAHPSSRIGVNAYVTSKAALEAHTVNLAAELYGSGVTANVYRPGIVNTTMQDWIRDQDPERIGAELHQFFTRLYDKGELISAYHAAKALLAHLPIAETGGIWDVTDSLI